MKLFRIGDIIIPKQDGSIIEEFKKAICVVVSKTEVSTKIYNGNVARILTPGLLKSHIPIMPNHIQVSRHNWIKIGHKDDKSFSLELMETLYG